MATAIGTYATTANVKTRFKITDAVDDTLIGRLCDQVNAFIESSEGAGRVLAPISSADYFFNGYDAVDNLHVLYVPNGIRAITTVSVASTTGAALVALPAADWLLEPSPQRRSPGWPALAIRIKDIVTGSVPYFFPGYENVKFTGATLGWAAMPDEVIDIAETLVIRAYQTRRAGQSDQAGNDATGQAVITRGIPAAMIAVLKSYQGVPI